MLVGGQRRDNSGFSINNDLLLMAEKQFGDFSVDGFIGGSIYIIQIH